ncbi:uncharacterized protein LOC125506861 [Triticum urartu]|uniref:uncharacterized protein LOC125506861 n=1 Tax=Triticum urartu TaxID=4572 RepID=UPI002043D23E|nr:uncharacterized protein LOC125506861 [Triticum urartu]
MAGRKEMALNLAKFIDKGVQVKLTGGRQVTGTLKGYDLLLNLVLDEAVESEREGELEEIEKGLEPLWERLVHLLERIVDRLNVVHHIKAVKDSPDLCAAVEDVQMLAFHVSSRASRRRSRKKHSSSSSELVQGVMKPLMLIRIGTN